MLLIRLEFKTTFILKKKCQKIRKLTISKVVQIQILHLLLRFLSINIRFIVYYICRDANNNFVYFAKIDSL